MEDPKQLEFDFTHAEAEIEYTPLEQANLPTPDWREMLYRLGGIFLILAALLLLSLALP